MFESVSLSTTCCAPAATSPTWISPTRNLYRSAIEELARGSQLTELEIARRRAGGRRGRRRRRRCAAARSRLSPDRRRAARPSSGRIGFRPPRRLRSGALRDALGIAGYVGAIAFVAGVVLCLPLPGAGGRPAWSAGAWRAAGAARPSAGDRCGGRARQPRRHGGFGATLLPAWSCATASRRSLRTLVAVPTLLTSRRGVEEQIERLEVHYLASPDGDLYFALLSDWADAADGDDAEDDAPACGGARGHRAAQRALRPSAPAATAFCCSTAAGSGTKRRAHGWAGSASAASSTS